MGDSESNNSLSELRKDYTLKGLTEDEMDADPIRQFSVWMDEALAARIPEPTAMTLATATKDGKPSARIVLLKKFDSSGFVFFTNYESRKGRELSDNPVAALTFHWADLERQVRLIGAAVRVSRADSEAYFHTRPIGSQISAWASRQSRVLPNRTGLEKDVQRLEEQFRGKEIPLPSNWGGFRIIPSEIEFWQGRQNRLHDRLRYILGKNGSWILERLSP
jgi:pyridoxamine 5'-phosphate oxidase